jgi:predicted Zn-dependent protease
VLYAVSCALPAIARIESDSALRAAGAEHVSAGRLADAAAQAELAARLNPLSVDGLIAGASIAVRRDRPDDANRDLLRAVRRQPYDAELWVRLTLTEGAAGDRAAARRAALRAIALDPRSAETRRAAITALALMMTANESATATGSPLPG